VIAGAANIMEGQAGAAWIAVSLHDSAIELFQAQVDHMVMSSSSPPAKGDNLPGLKYIKKLDPYQESMSPLY